MASRGLNLPNHCFILLWFLLVFGNFGQITAQTTGPSAAFTSSAQSATTQLGTARLGTPQSETTEQPVTSTPEPITAEPTTPVSEAPQSTLSPSDTIRLVQLRSLSSSHAFSGRVEIYFNDGWGSICSSQSPWSFDNAKVACRQLGFGEASPFQSGGYYGPPSRPRIYDVECFGNETSILECPRRENGYSRYCSYSRYATVVCVPEVRLTGGQRDNEGVAEIKLRGVWGRACTSDWGMAEAYGVCIQLGFKKALEATTDAARFGQVSSPIIITGVDCGGGYKSILECEGELSTSITTSCEDGSVLGVVCSPETGHEVRLVRGTTPYQGRVEVKVNNTWGTVCDDYWDLSDAEVVCRQLGLGQGVAARRYGSYGRGAGPIHMDDVRCTGDEERLFDCPHRNGSTSCTHAEDAGVDCSPRIRLVDGQNQFQGRVELFVGGEWGTVCDTDWDNSDARVVCRQLGFGNAAIATTGSAFGGGSGPIVTDNIGCRGYENSLGSCPNILNVEMNITCDHSRDAGVICVLPENHTISLVGGENPYEGRVEIEIGGALGTICDNGWNKANAGVICRQLGFGPVVDAPGGARYGQGEGPIYVSNLNCRGSEPSISSCRLDGAWLQNCTHANDAGVVCSAPIRLVGGLTPFEGRVEVFKSRSWGVVCDDEWDLVDADVVCKELGFGAATRAVRASNYGPRSYNRILMDDVACTGTESRLRDCPHSTTHDCSSYEHAGVICSEPDLRCNLPVLPSYAYINIVKHGYDTDEVIAIICNSGNSSVEWTCDKYQEWSGPPLSCPQQTSPPIKPQPRVSTSNNTLIAVTVVLVLLVLGVAILVLLLLLRGYRIGRNDNAGAIALSDILTHVDTIKTLANRANHDSATGEDRSLDGEPRYDCDEQTTTTSGYSRLINQ